MQILSVHVHSRASSRAHRVAPPQMGRDAPNILSHVEYGGCPVLMFQARSGVDGLAVLILSALLRVADSHLSDTLTHAESGRTQASLLSALPRAASPSVPFRGNYIVSRVVDRRMSLVRCFRISSKSTRGSIKHMSPKSGLENSLIVDLVLFSYLRLVLLLSLTLFFRLSSSPSTIMRSLFFLLACVLLPFDSPTRQQQ